ncbi:MAG: hypothetical protein J0M08_13050 [Bacteroidetes bacterium]|nr:hypothetical protein [Bacteroidota bacterium]
MELSNYYTIRNINSVDESIFEHGVFLVLLNVAKTPPHLALIANGKWYSLDTNGPTINGDTRLLLKLIQQKQLKTIVVGLSSKNIIGENITTSIAKVMEKYTRVDIHIATCFTPIKEFCGSFYNIKTDTIDFVYDLLPVLEQQNYITGVYEINLSSNLTNKSFQLKKYSMEDVFDSIRKHQTV